MDERRKKHMIEAKVGRRMLQCSHYFAATAKIKVEDKWDCRRNGGLKNRGEVVSGRLTEIERVWKRYFDHLMNKRIGGEAAMTCVGMEMGGLQLSVQGEIGREEVRKQLG